MQISFWLKDWQYSKKRLTVYNVLPMQEIDIVREGGTEPSTELG
jgi:hypothetical protein